MCGVTEIRKSSMHAQRTYDGIQMQSVSALKTSCNGKNRMIEEGGRALNDGERSVFGVCLSMCC